MRISRHQMFMEIACVVSKRSTCFRENVGCIITRENKIISIGYNGRPSGDPHCQYHPQGKCTKSIHAESNAIRFLLEGHHSPTKDYNLYVTHLPCVQCTNLIINSNMIKRVFFQILYGDTEPIYKLLDENNIQLHRILPSGSLTSHDRSELYDEIRDNR